MKRVVMAFAACLTLAVVAAPASGAPRRADLTRPEAKLLRKVAGEWVKLGKWCVSNKLPAQAKTCLAAARQAAATSKAVKQLAVKLEGCADGGDPARWTKKRASTGKKVAKLYDKLFAAGSRIKGKQQAAARARFDEYLWRALEAEPTSGRWKRVLLAVEGAQDPQRAGGLAARALKLEPPADLAEKLDRILDLKAVDKLVLRAAKAHPIKYWFSLPKAWRPDAKREWPVLVCVDGAGSGFRGMGNGYVKGRQDLPYIVVSPCTFANTNAIQGKMRDRYRKLYTDQVIDEAGQDRFGWDEAGLLAILKDLARYKAEKQIYITGFSGGGNLTYLMTFKHPDLVKASAPACANFSQTGYASLKDAFPPQARDFPIHIMTGAKDPHRTWTHGKVNGVPGIEPQTDNVVATLKAVGHSRFTRTLVPGLGHSPARKQVIAFFAPYMKGEKKRSE